MSDDIATLRRILKTCRTVAVVGLSAEWHRPSHFVGKYLQGHGYRVIPVNPRYDRILGEKSYARLEDIPERVDMVDVFRRTEDVLPFARSAVAIGAKCLWQQMGVANAQADALARAAGLDSVMDRCVKIEHARLFGGLRRVGRGRLELAFRCSRTFRNRTPRGGSRRRGLGDRARPPGPDGLPVRGRLGAAGLLGGVAVAMGAVAVIAGQDLPGVVQQDPEHVVPRLALHPHAVLGGLADGAARLDDVEHPLHRPTDDERIGNGQVRGGIHDHERVARRRLLEEPLAGGDVHQLARGHLAAPRREEVELRQRGRAHVALVEDATVPHVALGGAITTLARGATGEFLFNSTGIAQTRQLIITIE